MCLPSEKKNIPKKHTKNIYISYMLVGKSLVSINEFYASYAHAHMPCHNIFVAFRLFSLNVCVYFLYSWISGPHMIQ